MKTAFKVGLAAVGLYILAKKAKKQETPCTCTQTHPAPDNQTAFTPGINPNPKPTLQASSSLAGKLVG